MNFHPSKNKLLTALLTLLVAVTYSNASYAQTTSMVGNGQLYYCANEDAGDGTFHGYLYRASNNNFIRFNVALYRTYTKILALLEEIDNRRSRGQAVRTLRQKLSNMRQTRTDIINCRRHGTTGRDPNLVNTPNNACAIVGNKSSITSEIINGQQCTIGNTGIVYVGVVDRFGGLGSCTGTVVRKAGETLGRVVIFAAHCLEDVDGVFINTPEGEVYANFFGSFPAWNPSSNFLEDGDVAIAIFDSYIQTQSYRILGSKDVAVGESAVIAGYGENENGNSSSSRLRAGFVTISESNSFSLANNYNGSQSNTCYGDSGGPLLVKRGEVWQLAAVTSNGINDDCGVGDTSYYALLANTEVKYWLNVLVPGLVD